MKKIAFATALILFAAGAFSQAVVDFSPGLRPGNSYEQKMVQKMKVTIDFDSSSEVIISKMKENGLTNPTVKPMDMIIESTTETGNPDKQSGNFPVRLLISNEKVNDKPIFSDGTTFYGKATTDQMPVYDSIGTVSDTAKKAGMLEMINSMVNQLKLPAKKMVLGDTFQVVTPFRVPVQRMSFTMNMISVYHLNKISDSTAFFDYKISIEMNMGTAEIPMTGSGSGSGDMAYDMRNHFQHWISTKYQIRFRMQKDELYMHLALESDAEVNCTVKKI